MKNFLQGIKYAYPIMIGYLPIAVSFGAMASASDFSPILATAMSATVFAGASQFIAVAMVAQNISIFQIILTTFVVNLRHLVMSFSILPKTRNIPVKNKIPLFMGITDETFAVISFKEDPALKTSAGFAGLVISSYLSWVTGTFFGSYIVSYLSPEFIKSLSVALYALFISLLINALFSNFKHLITITIAILLNIILSYFISSSWAILIAIVVAPLINATIKNRSKRKR